MGLYYSICTYVKSENLSKALDWLNQNSWDLESSIKPYDEVLKINGDFNNLEEDFQDKKTTINTFDSLSFTTNLIFDIDAKIVASLSNWGHENDIDFVDDFKELFETLYLGKGKIRIGGFDSTLSKLRHHNIYKFEFTACSSDMSAMLESSMSVKKWIIDFSKHANSILSGIDFEGDLRVLFYNGNPTLLMLKEEFNDDIPPSVQHDQKAYSTYQYERLIERIKLFS